MSSGYIYFYLENGVIPDLETFERVLKPVGLSLENPSTEQVVMLSSSGARTVTSRETISALIAEKRDVSTQWWFTDSEDVYCRFNPHTPGHQWTIEFGLDGVESDAAEALIGAIVTLFKQSCAQDEAAALVVDRTGELEDVDWNAVVKGNEELRYVPDILVVPRDIRTPGFEAVREEISECPQHAILKAPQLGAASIHASKS